MKKILSKAKECGARVLLFAIPLVEEKLFSSCFNPKGRYQNNETVAVYNATLRQIADEEQITVFEHFWLAGEDLTEFFEPDGVHLSIKAQELFAKAWLVNATKFI